MRSRSIANVRAVAIDVDGTLLRPDNTLSHADKEALQLAAQLGVAIVLASSRSPSSLARIQSVAGISGAVIAHQGGWIGTVEPTGVERVIWEERLPLDVALDVAARASRFGLAPSWFCGSTWQTPCEHPMIAREQAITGDHPQFVGSVEGFSERPHRVFIMAPNSAGAELLDELEREFAGTCTTARSHTLNLEVTALGVGKGSALRVISAELDVALANFAAIGDGDNDLGMFSVAGTAVAMGNASMRVKSEADAVTGANDDAGVASALRMLLAHGNR